MKHFTDPTIYLCLHGHFWFWYQYKVGLVYSVIFGGKAKLKNKQLINDCQRCPLFSAISIVGNPQMITLRLLSTYHPWVRWQRNPRRHELFM